MRSHNAKNSSRPRSLWPVSYRWIAVGTLIAYSPIGTQKFQVALAQTALPPTRHRDATAPEPTALTFAIAPGPLGAAIPAFERLTQLHVVISEQRIRDIESPGVSGVFRPDRALTVMLRDTGVSFRFTAPDTVALQLAGVSTTLNVEDSSASLAPSLPNYTEPLRDIPQSIDVVSQATMQQQNATTLRDALRNVAGISLAAGEGGSQGDNLTVRGFSARSDLFIDGMRDFGSYYRDPFDVQEVQVLQGPSSMEFGRGSTGGVVNQATKVPGLNRFFSGDFDFGTDLTRHLTADINTPAPALGKNTAFRLSVMGNEGDVAGRNVAENRRMGVAPSLAFGLGTPTRVTLNYFHQNADDIPDYGIPWLFNGPAPVNRSNYYGFARGNFLRTCDGIGTVKVEHDFNAHLTLRSQSRYANYVRDAQITEPQLIAPVTPAMPLGAIAINRNEIAVRSVESYLTDQLDLTANFRTGRVQHTVVAGVEAAREISDPVRPKFTNGPVTGLLNPNPNDVFTGTPAPSTDVHTTANSAGVSLLDTLKFGRRWELTSGIRWDRMNAHSTQQVAPAAAFNRLDEKPSWRAGLVYHPAPSGSVYATASTSFNPSAESLSLSAGNANLPPEENRNIEAGTKWDFSGAKLSLRGALFETVKNNAREPDPTNPLLNVLAGRQRVRGAEASVNGHIKSRWEMLASYAYLDGRVVSSQYYPGSIGAQLANVPANTFNFWSTYRLPKHWQVGAGGNFVDSRTASSTAPFDPVTGLVRKAPSYWVFNAMASHAINEHVSLQANVYNLANRYYYDELHPAHIVLGPGRSALIGLKFHF